MVFLIPSMWQKSLKTLRQETTERVCEILNQSSYDKMILVHVVQAIIPVTSLYLFFTPSLCQLASNLNRGDTKKVPGTKYYTQLLPTTKDPSKLSCAM